MRPVWILLMPLLVAGCATPRPVARQVPAPVALAAALPTKLVETRYEIRGYREGANPAIRHEAHAVYRRTRVPITAGEELGTVPRTTYPPVSFAPLSASDELTAELATQKKVTADLRVMQTAMAETEQRMQAQYATLVRQSTEAMKVRGQLEAERGRVRSAAPPDSATAAPAGATVANSTEAKW